MIRLKQTLAVLLACVAVMIGWAALARAGYGLAGIGQVEAVLIVFILVFLSACSMLLRARAAEGEFRPPFFVVMLGALLHRGEPVPTSPDSPQPPGGLAQEPQGESPDDDVPGQVDEVGVRRRADRTAVRDS
ncbi:MAG TPA: hypothetical protein VF647_11815 [Longimicrobium sp.]|jgi:hypothetical protein